MILEPPVKVWYCPACKLEHVDTDRRARQPMHPCPRLKGLTMPFTLDRGAGYRLVDRGDYVRGDDVQTDDDGRVVMAIETHHTDRAPDVTVLAPCLNIRAAAH